MYSPENGEYIRHFIDHRDNHIKLSKDFTWHCTYWTVWTSYWETASSERCCVLFATPVASWSSRESNAYDKWSRCTATKRIGWTLAFLQFVHIWRETYSEKNLWWLQWVQEQLLNQSGQENWQVEGKNVHVQPSFEINTIWYFDTRKTASA